MAEALLRSRLKPDLPVTVESAGVRALVGHGVETPSAIALRELGGDCGEHAARQLTGELVARADLILTAESLHRTHVVHENPLAFRKTFTMREFARLGATLGSLDTEPSENALRERVAEVAGQRGWAEPPLPGGDEIGDPFGAPLKVARVCAAGIAEAVDGIVAALGLA